MNTPKRNTALDTAMLTLLFKIASFVGSQRFMQVFQAEQCRFKVKNVTKLFEKLRYDFSCQLTSSINNDYVRGYRETNGGSRQDIPVDCARRVMARDLLKLAEVLLTQLSEVTINQADRKFVVPKGEQVLSTVYSRFNAEALYELNSWLSGFVRHAPYSPGDSVRTFDARNFLSSLAVLIESINTLANRTAHSGYEIMLFSLMKDVDYFVKGYPHDILAHDVRSLNDADNEYVAIAVNREYAASMMVTQEMLGKVPPSHRFYNL